MTNKQWTVDRVKGSRVDLRRGRLLWTAWGNPQQSVKIGSATAVCTQYVVIITAELIIIIIIITVAVYSDTTISVFISQLCTAEVFVPPQDIAKCRWCWRHSVGVRGQGQDMKSSSCCCVVRQQRSAQWRLCAAGKIWTVNVRLARYGRPNDTQVRYFGK